MRIAHFIHRYPPALGGSEAYFARLSEHLVGQGHFVQVFTSNALDLTAFWSPSGTCLPARSSLEKGVEVVRYPLWRFRGRRYLLGPLSLLPNRLWQCLTMPCNPISFGMWSGAGSAARNFDVVHATAFPYAWPVACARRLARRQRIPFVVTPFLHTGDPEDPDDPVRRAYLAPKLLWLLYEADCILVQTPTEREALLRRGFSASSVVLQGLGVDPAECTGGDRAQTRQGWGVAHQTPVVGHLANNSEEKGTVDLLRAAERLWSRGVQFRVVLAGPEMPNFGRFWQTFPRKQYVLRLGRLTEPQKRDFYSGIDVFALPSRSDSFGLVLLEAWANGVANVGYRAGGIADVIRHQTDGLLVKCGDIEGLANALARVVLEDDLRKQYAIAGQKRLEKDFRWTEKLELVHQLYHRLTPCKDRTRERSSQNTKSHLMITQVASS
ncbi:MAG: glycosyltransferase family 4 protein [Gemmataceae bacterium]